MKKTIQMIVITITILLFFSVQRLVVPKYATDIQEGGFIKEYYKETLPHEVLMVGDCELYENFSPIVLWEKYGITSYIRGSAQQLPWQSYYLLEEMLQKEKPKVVIFNVLELKNNQTKKEEYNRMTLDGMKWSRSKIKAIKTSMLEEESFLSYVFPIFRYHSRITELKSEDFQYFSHEKQHTTAGYFMRVDVAPYEEGIWEETEPDSYQFGQKPMEYLDKMRVLCEENNINFLLVKAPSLSPKWYDKWEKQVEDYAKKYNIRYINFLELIDTIGIDYTKDTYDEGLHMNLSGAEKCADYLGNYLKEHYMIEDMRQYEKVKNEWDKKVKFYYEMKEKQEKELEKYGEIKSY